MSGRQQADEKRQQEPFDGAELAAEVAGQMKGKGEAELSGVAKYYRMAGLPAKKALDMAAYQAAASIVRYLSQGLISATVEGMEKEGGKGKRTYTVRPGSPLRLTLKPWEYYVEYVVRANGATIAAPQIDYEIEVRLEIQDAALRRFSDGGYELSLGKALFGCRVSLKRPGGNLLIADLKSRGFSFAEPITYSGSEKPEEESSPCPFGSASACPYRRKAEGELPAKPG